MKKIFVSLLCIAFISIAYTQNGYMLKARLKNLGNHKAVLAYSLNGKLVLDSNYTTEGENIIFKGKVSETVLANFLVRNMELSIKMDRGFIPSPSLQLFLSNEEIKVDGDADEIYLAKVSGGKANREWESIKSKQAQLTDGNWKNTKSIYAKFAETKDSSVFKSGSADREKNAKEEQMLQKKFIRENPASLVSMYFLANMVNSMSVGELETSYEKLALENKASYFAKRIADKISNSKATAIGNKAIEINKKDMNGNPVSLATLKGKYVLLDFWGSWCGPCRQGHPHMKEIYSKYKEKGFEIVGIAQEQASTLAQNKTAWLGAVKQDGINWIQVLNNEGSETFDAVQSYGVTAFPTKILLDKEGKIIGRYVGEGDEGSDFGKKLKEIFGE